MNVSSSGANFQSRQVTGIDFRFHNSELAVQVDDAKHESKFGIKEMILGSIVRPIEEPALFDSTVTVQKLLNRPKRRLVQFFGTPQQTEVHAKFLVQRLRVIPDNIETAALRGSLRSESTNDDMATMSNGPGDLANISNSVSHRSKKMKDGAIVPHVISRCLQPDSRDVRDKPVDTL